jgi:glycosyltransferase involved in cell wall biosynthesis
MKQERALVSIAIATYNQAQSVARAVRNALAQDYSNLEVVVADDDSKDDTRQILTQFTSDLRFRYLRNDHNLGRVGNYRHLLRDLVRGAWILINDGDDYLTDTKYISKAMALIESDPQIALVTAKLLKSGRGRDDEVLNGGWKYPAIVDGNEFFLKHPPFGTLGPLHLATLYNREAALKLDFYRRDIFPTDFESLYRLMTGHHLGFVDEVVGVWCQHSENATRNPNRRRLTEGLALFESLYLHARAISIVGNADLVRWYRARLARAWLSGVKSLVMRNRRPLDAIAFGYDVLRRDPWFWVALPKTVFDIARERS